MSRPTDTANPLYPIVTPEIIEAATRRGRQERSQAIWELLSGLFGSVSRDRDVSAAHRAAATRGTTCPAQ